MSADIETVVKDCEKCATYQNKLPKEPLKPLRVPDLSFQQVSVDLFEFESNNYIVLVDNYSKFIEVDELSYVTSATAIKALKSQFARHGIPETVRSDNGAQFTSASFHAFTNNYGFQLETSSPHYHRSNGQAERAVQIVKHLWRKTSDRHKALLDYRTTPLESTQLSPAQMLMGRRLRNTLPISKQLLEPAVSTRTKEITRNHLQQAKAKQKLYHDRGSAACETLPLEIGDNVRIQPISCKKSGKQLLFGTRNREQILTL